MTRRDAILLGSSPNALACAARLGKAGLQVLLLDTAATPGGPVATDELSPGLFAEAGVPSLALDLEIIRALGLDGPVIRRDTVTSLGPQPFTLRSMPTLPSAVGRAIELLRAAYRTVPPAVFEEKDFDVSPFTSLGARLTALGTREMHEVLRLLFIPARDYFEEVLADEKTRAVCAAIAVRALSTGPFAAGTMFSFLHQHAVDDGFSRCTAPGGLRTLVAAMAEKARAAGVEIRTSAPGPLRVAVENGVADGVLLGNGERIASEWVISDFDAHTTFTELVSPRDLGPEDNRAVRSIRHRGTAARVTLALRGQPDFPGVDADALRGTLVIAPDVKSIERAWDEAKRGKLPARPVIEAALPTIADPSLAPAGQHVLDAWVQYVPTAFADRQAVVKAVIDALAPHAPGLPGLVREAWASLPVDLEKRFSLREGHLYGGEVRLGQSFFLRPLPGYARYETPIPRLYLCGSAAHPGGYSGRSGWNLAGALLGQ